MWEIQRRGSGGRAVARPYKSEDVWIHKKIYPCKPLARRSQTCPYTVNVEGQAAGRRKILRSCTAALDHARRMPT
jgi:hypothetical protein